MRGTQEPGESGDGSQIKDNNATMSGGGIYLFGAGAAVTMTGGSIERNEAAEGGGVYNDSGTCALGSVLVKDNSATGWGGGLHSRGAINFIIGCTFDGNTATAGGSKISWEAAGGFNGLVLVQLCTGVDQSDVTQKM